MYSSSAKMFFGLSVFFVVVLTVDGLFVSAGAMGSGKKSVSSEKRGPPWNKFGAFVKSKFAKSSKRSESVSLRKSLLLMLLRSPFYFIF